MAQWLPVLAAAVGAPRPRRVPAAIARLVAGSYGVSVMTRGQAADGGLAGEALGFRPEISSWREGFATALG